MRKPWIRTVNAWLIILCVAVFIVDGFMAGPNGRGTATLETGTYWVPVHTGDLDGPWKQLTGTPFFGTSIRPDSTRVDPTQVHRSVELLGADGKRTSRSIRGLPIYDRASGTLIGIAEGTSVTALHKAMHFSTKRVIGGAELWRLITFQFVHADEYHLLFNMLALYFFGVLIENVLGAKRYLAFYLICGVSGGLLYLLLNLGGYLWVEQAGLQEIPGLLFNATGSSLIGASAGVFGVLIGGAYLAPQAKVLLFFVIPMRLATLAWVLIAISIGTLIIGWENAGGEAAHLGGAIAGWALIRHPQRLHRFFDWLGRFDPTSRQFRSGGGTAKRRVQPNTEEIDRILAKISREGLQSLTKAEKRALQKASEGDGS
ncbi:MAG: rhomboid family intramembrane serine protease [Phycisphaerales bacterium]|nr:rhomboid family intramembrane serine protease [Phycisphaerales bacterium]